MSGFIQLAVLGMASGSLYALSALGVVVVYRSSGVLNLANGAFAMVAAYTTYSLTDQAQVPVLLGVMIAILASILLSLAVYVLVMRPLASSSTLTQLVATLAVYLVAQSTIQLIYGPINKVPNVFLPTRSVDLLGVKIGADSLITVATGVVMTALLWTVYRYTKFGMATTAVSENPRALSALGISVDAVRATNWVVAGLLGGVSGVLIAPITQITPFTFLLFLVPSLAAAVVGGMTSFPVTLAAGMVVGAAEVLTARYVDFTGVRDAVPFIIVMIVLAVRGDALPGRGFRTEMLPRVGSGAVRPVRTTIAVVALTAAVYFFLEDSLVTGTIVMAAIGIIALSQVVITGYAGQLSLAQMTMAGIGGLIAAQLILKFEVPFIVALGLSALSMIPIGVLVGLPALRARGIALAIATLSFGVAVNGLVLTNADLNGGLVGISVGAPSLFGIDLNPILSPRSYMVFVVVVLVLVGLVVANLRRGRAGRRLLAIRTNERAAAALGIDVTAAKLYAFVLAAMIAAVGGVLLLFRNPSVVVSSGFDVFASISTVAFSVLGGIGYVGGALVAASFNTSAVPAVALSDGFSAFDMENVLTVWLPLVGGLALLVQLIFQPSGIVDSIVQPRKRAPGKDRKSSKLPPRIAAQLAASASADRGFRGASLTVDGATVKYGQIRAVSDVSFQVSPGEVLSVIGPNGAGKTSLMDGITGFAPMSGRVELGNQQIDGWRAHRRARAGLVRSFQTLELLEDMTVLDNLRAAADSQDLWSYVIDLLRPGRGGLTPAIAAAVKVFNLEAHLMAVPTDLGFGERRLVAIARAVAGEPSVLLLDEPAAGLSEAERVVVGDLIRMIADEWNIAVVLIEHDVSLVRRVSDRVVALDFGEVIVSGPPDVVLADPRVIEAYLGHGGSDVGPSEDTMEDRGLTAEVLS